MITPKKAGLAIAGATVAGSVAGTVASLGRSPGRKLDEGEDLTGKVLWRRSKVPLIRHYGVGVSKDKILHVQPAKDPKTGKMAGHVRKIVPLSDFARETTKDGLGKDRKVHVHKSSRKTPKLQAELRGYAATAGKKFDYNTEKANCETLANCVARTKKSSDQIRETKAAIMAGGTLAGVGTALALRKKVRFESLEPGMIELGCGGNCGCKKCKTIKLSATGQHGDIRGKKKTALYAGGGLMVGGAGYYVGKHRKVLMKPQAWGPAAVILGGAGLVKYATTKKKDPHMVGKVAGAVGAGAFAGPLGAAAGETIGGQLQKDLMGITHSGAKRIQRKIDEMSAIEPGMIEFNVLGKISARFAAANRSAGNAAVNKGWERIGANSPELAAGLFKGSGAASAAGAKAYAKTLFTGAEQAARTPMQNVAAGLKSRKAAANLKKKKKMSPLTAGMIGVGVGTGATAAIAIPTALRHRNK